ncbi:MAG: DUF885 domain-containing protein, partial [Candidatus Solibacter usitatus]|nr:DUF885 domain-containing protein [Candidatus Solibacter usitatus]
MSRPLSQAGFFFLLALSLRAGEFDTLVDRFFDQAYFRFHPTEATSAGFHEYDNRLEDYSRASIRAETAALKRFLGDFQKFPSEPDCDLVIARIRARLLDLETIRMWEKNPDSYSGGITNSVFVIMSRSFAPAPTRLEALIARERQIPGVLAAARANLKNPPRIYTEIALEQLPGIVKFFEKDVPAAFQSVTQARLLRDFEAANRGVIEALTQYQSFLRDRLLPQSNGDFRIGGDAFRQKLLFEEMVDTPLDRLLEIGYQDLRRNQAALRGAAARIDSRREPRAVLGDLERDGPAPGKLLQAFRDVLGVLREFIQTRNIVTIPSPVPPILQETPPFMRALTFASMDTPGPYETMAKEAFFNVTLPEPDWSPQRIAEHMAGFNRGTVISTAIHEAYPGHYTQFLWVQRASSKTRRLLGCGTNSEGWAHYAEQMMLDEGYGKGDLKLRLGQIQDALLRNGRYIAGIQMHTGKMTYEQGVDFFMKEGFQSRANAER